MVEHSEARYQKTFGEKVFAIVNLIMLSLAGLCAFLPIVHVLAKSFSGNNAVVAGAVGFWPVGFQLGNYEFALAQKMFIRSFGNSIFITAVGTFLSLFFTVTTAYPLSKPWLRGRKFFLLLYIFAMLFYGGIVPAYMLVRALNLINTLWSVILPFLIVPFNMLVIKTFMEGLPESVEESAMLDGACDAVILMRIVLPMCAPSLATVGLFYAVTYWNGYFHASMYISDPALKPMQLYLYEIFTASNSNIQELSVEEMLKISPGGVQSASIILSILPMVILYPILQKYFVKGMVLGSVKG